jgi:hypothetical protein
MEYAIVAYEIENGVPVGADRREARPGRKAIDQLKGVVVKMLQDGEPSR